MAVIGMSKISFQVDDDDNDDDFAFFLKNVSAEGTF